MNKSQVKKIVADLIQKSMASLEAENPKVDLKRQWYDLTDKKGVNEFIKDTTAIANTYGLDGFLIFGFDEKKGTYQNAKSTDNGLRDSNEITNLISSRCSDLFDFNIYDFEIDGHQISVIHIPPTLAKPIVIPKYQTFDKKGNIIIHKHKIFVRKGTSTTEASKHDIELMYYDRKNIIPDYAFKTYINAISTNLKYSTYVVFINLAIANLGRRPAPIKRINGILKLEDGSEIRFDRPFRFNDEATEGDYNLDLTSSNLIIRANDVVNESLRFMIYPDREILRKYSFDIFKLNDKLNKAIKEIHFNYVLPDEKVFTDVCKIKSTGFDVVNEANTDSI